MHIPNLYYIITNDTVKPAGHYIDYNKPYNERDRFEDLDIIWLDVVKPDAFAVKYHKVVLAFWVSDKEELLQHDLVIKLKNAKSN